jgi:DNA polymerase-3 subunit epsilon
VEEADVNFAAIDFETANRDRRSACAVGIAIVRGGKVVETYSSLIRPPNPDFLQSFVRMHHITPQQVRKAPTFRDIWPEIQSRCGTGVIAAHNAAFDVGVLTSCLEDCRLERLTGQCLCTLTLARALLPGLPNHKLTTLTDVFGIPIEHHDAASDALACAEVAIRLEGLAGPDGIGPYCREFGNLGPDEEIDTESCEEGVILSLPKSVTQYHHALVHAAPPDGRFEGKQFAFTGEMTFLGREVACDIVAAQGGTARNSVSKKTDYLVVGEEVLGAFKRMGETTGKLARAVAIREAGGSIQIIGAPEFLNMIR